MVIYLLVIYLSVGAAFGYVCYIHKHTYALNSQGIDITAKSILYNIFTDPTTLNYQQQIKPAKLYVAATLLKWLLIPMATWPLGMYLRHKFEIKEI